ncbi:hypothetical protein B0T24DRAFT_627815 [Lasiosphaeria ovina]|uniref:Uncharacterized protein n=1 Tax=Lasiosphaeria ovina TaxID=92902 RepID=A0AAE0N6E2_9PEZI|nr:hypothetical protein B0T24DRAFT_627815 [Lasiosphaeria ovina]
MCRICYRIGNVSPPRTEEEYAREEVYNTARDEADHATWEAYYQSAPQPEHLNYIPTVPRKLVVEPVPSHDGAPVFAAWMAPLDKLEADASSPDGYSNSPPLIDAKLCRPISGIRIYNTTPNATSERAALLVRRISELTRMRIDDESSDEDRIEVVVLRQPKSVTVDERVALCTAHNSAERKIRNAMYDGAAAASWYIPEHDERNCMKIWIIDDLKVSWEQALRSPPIRPPGRRDGVASYPAEQDAKGIHGSFLEVTYDRIPDPEDEDDGELLFYRHDLESLGECLAEFRGFRGNVYRFFQSHFMPDGVLEKELAHTRAERAELETEAPIEGIDDSAWNSSQGSDFY